MSQVALEVGRGKPVEVLSDLPGRKHSRALVIGATATCEHSAFGWLTEQG